MPTNVVEIRELTRRFGGTKALDELSLTVEAGSVYGLVGANGAGKTTLLKHLLGLLKAEAGVVRVFGMDPVRHPVEVLGRVGYLSEERDLPEWMRIEELLRYTRAFHAEWDEAFARELLDTFALDPAKKVKNLSKGMRAQAGLIAAVAHRPELLLLDEPSTGLDAIVRKDILNAIIRMVADEGRTVIFSSHLLDEVELMSDYVFMVNEGRLILEGSLDLVKEQHQLLSVRFGADRTEPPRFRGILSAERRGPSWSLVCNGAKDQILATLGAAGGEVTHARNASLQEIFVARVGRDRFTTLEA